MHTVERWSIYNLALTCIAINLIITWCCCGICQVISPYQKPRLQHEPALNITPLQTVRRRCPAGCRAQKGIAGAFHSPFRFARRKDDCCLSDSSLCTSWIFDWTSCMSTLTKFNRMMAFNFLPFPSPDLSLISGVADLVDYHELQKQKMRISRRHLYLDKVSRLFWQGRIWRETLLQYNKM